MLLKNIVSIKFIIIRFNIIIINGNKHETIHIQNHQKDIQACIQYPQSEGKDIVQRP